MSSAVMLYPFMVDVLGCQQGNYMKQLLSRCSFFLEEFRLEIGMIFMSLSVFQDHRDQRIVILKVKLVELLASELGLSCFCSFDDGVVESIMEILPTLVRACR